MSSALRPALLRLAAGLLCLLLVSGCSMVRVGYNQLDNVAAWMAHDYFDLESAQRDQFAQRFEKLHAWHRHEELPEYARFLGDIRQRAAKGLRADDMLWVVDGFRQRYARIAARSAADAADLLATLTDAQVEHVRKQLDKDNAKFVKEHRSDENEATRRRAADRRALSQLRDWVGSLSDAQEERIRALLRDVPLVDQLRHQDRLRRQREFLDLLKLRRGERKAFAQKIGDWLQHWEAGREPAQARAFENSWRKRAEFYAAVDRMLTAEQRSHLLHRLQDFIDDFRQLAERPGAPAQTR